MGVLNELSNLTARMVIRIFEKINFINFKIDKLLQHLMIDHCGCTMTALILTLATGEPTGTNSL